MNRFLIMGTTISVSLKLDKLVEWDWPVVFWYIYIYIIL